VVVRQSAFQIRGRPSDDVRQMTITITADDRREWTYQLAGWRPVAVGLGCGQAHLWSAGDLVVLAGAPGEDPRVLAVDSRAGLRRPGRPGEKPGLQRHGLAVMSRKPRSRAAQALRQGRPGGPGCRTCRPDDPAGG
jgi:hypothetical protein